MCWPATCRTRPRWKGLIKRAGEAMGGVEIQVNNAGITKDGLMMRMSDEDWATVLDVNLTATFRLCRQPFAA